MKTFKKALAVVMCVVMMLTAAPLSGFVGLELPEFGLFGMKAEAASYSGKCGDNLTWSLDTATGVLTISGTGDMYNWLVFIFRCTLVQLSFKYQNRSNRRQRNKHWRGCV